MLVIWDQLALSKSQWKAATDARQCAEYCDRMHLNLCEVHFYIEIHYLILRQLSQNC